MAIISATTVSSGLIDLLKTAVNFQAGSNLILKAFTSNTTISEATVLSDLTEATNYTSATLTGSNFSVTYGTGKATALYGVTTSLPFTGSNSVYGIFITNAAGTILIAAGRYLTPKSVESGDSITIDALSISLDNI